MNHKEKLFKSITDRFKSVYLNSDQLALMFNRNYITVQAFKKIIDDLKVKPAVKESDTIKDLFSKLNDALDVIYKAAEDFAKVNESTTIPVVYIKQLVDESIKGFSKA